MLKSGVTGPEYIYKLKQELEAALDEFTPDLIIYNAGTDCLENDPLGLMNLSANVIILFCN